MKKITLFAWITVLTVFLCACRMNDTIEETTIPTTIPVTTVPEPSTTMPTVPDLTIETNIPDTNVDDDHLIDTTDETIDDTASGINLPYIN